MRAQSPPPPSMMRGPPPPPPLGLAPPGKLPPPGMFATLPPPGGPMPQSIIEFPRAPAPGGPPDPSQSHRSEPDSPPKLGQHVPLAKCRCLYIGTAVPTETAVGIEAVQQPLKDRYYTSGAAANSVHGIDAWLTAFSSGLLLQYVGDKNLITWFPIHSLHVSAAVKCVPQIRGLTAERTLNFVSLDTPVAQSSDHPPIFAAIMRRTSGVKVLECHAFITKSDQAAFALVQSSTHAYEHKEGWVEDPPPKELYHTLEATLDPDETAQPELPIFQPSARDDKPPVKGYFLNSKGHLIKSFNVHHPNERPGPTRSMMLHPERLMTAVVPPPGMGPPRPLPRPPQRDPYDPYLLPTPAPPAEYFSDWDAFRDQPVVVFPGPYMSDDEYRRTMRNHRSKKRKPIDRHERTRPRNGRQYDREPRYATYDRPVATYDRYRRSPNPPPQPPPPNPRYERDYPDPRDIYRRPAEPPSDYIDDMGNRYYTGGSDDYGYRGELPARREQADYGGDPDVVMYAPRYMRHIEGDRPSDDIADRRYPSENGEGRDIYDPYKMNDYRGRDDLDLYRGGAGYGDLTRNLGYLP